MSNPWMKFYPRDWRGDQALRMVSLAARGLWMECMSIMHEASPYGHLLINGRRVEDDALARMVGASVDEVRTLMSELAEAGVYDVTGKGVIFSRRMVRDQERAAKGRKAVKKRWTQPSDDKGVSDGPNRSPNRSPITQKPEARTQKDNNPPSPLERGSRSRGLRLPDDWTPSEAVFEFAEQKLGLSRLQVSNISDGEFTDYWRAQPGAKGRKVDWDATLRNWLRRNVESGKTAPAASRTAGGERAAKVRRYIETGTPEKPGFWVTSWGDPPDDPASEYHAEWKRQGGDRPKLRAISGGRG